MTVDDRWRAAHARGWRVLTAGLVATLTFGYASLGTLAQDASPAASPTAECDAPDLPPGTPTPQDEASPTADMASPMASPEASPVTGDEASAPVVPEGPEGTPVAGDESDQISTAVENLANCVNGGDYEGAAALMTSNFLVANFGSANPYDAVANLEGTTFGDFTYDNLQTYEDGSVSADVQYQATQYQITKERWTLVDEDGTYKIDDLTPLTPDFSGDLAVVGVLLGENGDGTYYITPNVESTANAEGVMLHGVNEGAEAHQIVVLALPEGADPAGLLDGSVDEKDIQFYGQISLDPGEQGDLLLVGLPEGTLTLACFVPGPDGAPHAVHGMVSQLEITAV